MFDSLGVQLGIDLTCWIVGSRYRAINEEDAPRILWCAQWYARHLRKFIGKPRSERTNDPIYAYLVQRYRNEYCPHDQVLWNDDNKLRYDQLRPTIDDVLIRLGET